MLFLLEQAERNLNPRAREVALKTLDGIVHGGIRDHIGGGFHRYAVDPEWRVPHFEKMLYNQALITQALVQAYRITGRERYATAARETIGHVLRDLRFAGGAFATAFDAESKNSNGEKKEGAYFVWTPADLSAALGSEDAKIAAALFDVSEDGNFHGDSIPWLNAPLTETAKTLGMPMADLDRRLAVIKDKLRAFRDKRPPPLRDDKILTGWNALMIRAMADASVILSEPKYFEAASRAADFLWAEHYVATKELRRFSFEGQVTPLLATQPDYAYFGAALITLYDASQDDKWLKRAETIGEEMHKLFHDGEVGDYVMARTDDPIPPAKIRNDQPVPSGSAVALELFSKLARRTLSTEYLQRAHKTLAAISGIATQSAASSGYALKSADELLRGELGTIQYIGKGRVRVSLERREKGELSINLHIAPGWHVNAHKPLEDHFIPTVVGLQGPDDPKPVGVDYPKPVVQKLGFADNEMALYEGSISIPVKLADDAKPPRSVTLQAQACSDKICLDPETLVLTLKPTAVH